MKEIDDWVITYKQRAIDIFLAELDKALAEQDEIDRKAGVFEKIKRPIERNPLTTIKR